jgi:peptidoglycan/LPS O-acetylase OafA/YrhL
MARSDNGRIYALDILRGLAALVTLLWHYQHFFYIPGGHLPSDFRVESQPLYSIFSLFYLHGHRRVDVFFVLSGFVFFAIYFSRVNSGKIGWQTFTWLRLSRLYPLHFATLLTVAVAQIVSMSIDNTYIVYQFNDLKHFALQVLFASDWGFQDGFSFNAPVWSVSVEVLLYISFFIFAALSPRSEVLKTILVTAVIAISYVTERYLGGGVVAHAALCFYCGGVSCLIWQWLQRCPSLIPPVAILVGTFGAVSLGLYVRDFAKLANAPILGAIVFPCAVLELALLQKRFPYFGHAYPPSSAAIVCDLTTDTEVADGRRQG